MMIRVPLYSRYRRDSIIGHVSIELTECDINRAMTTADAGEQLQDEDRRIVADVVAMVVGRGLRAPLQRVPKKRRV